MNLLPIISEAWGWTGVEPEEILETNAFGNVLLRDTTGKVWRICPEELFCKVAAESQSDLEVLRRSPEFREDWDMTRLVDIANEKLGPLPQDRCYWFRLPPCFVETGYDIENLVSVPITEAIGSSGYMAQQIKDLPDGAQVKIVVKD